LRTRAAITDGASNCTQCVPAQEAWFDFFRVVGTGNDLSLAYCKGEQCKVNQFAGSGMAKCAPCAIGKTGAGLATCTDCAPGTYGIGSSVSGGCKACESDASGLTVMQSPAGATSKAACHKTPRTVAYTSFEEPDLVFRSYSNIPYYRDKLGGDNDHYLLESKGSHSPVAYQACSGNLSLLEPTGLHELGFRTFYHDLGNGGLKNSRIGVIGDGE
jgi:hypothetical protein